MSAARAAGYPVPWAEALSDTEMLVERIDGPTMADDLALRPWRLWSHARTLAALRPLYLWSFLRHVDRAAARRALGAVGEVRLRDRNALDGERPRVRRLARLG